MSMFRKSIGKSILLHGRNLAMESLEDRNLLSAVAFGTPTFDQDNATVSFTGSYTCDVEGETIASLNISGFYATGDYAQQEIDDVSHVDISFSDLNDLGGLLNDTEISSIASDDETENGGADSDTATDTYYQLAWGPDFEKPNEAVNLFTVTYKFDLEQLTDGEISHINFIAKENTGTEAVIGSDSFAIINDNSTLRLLNPTITVNPVSAEKYVSDFSEVTLDNPLVLAEVTASDFEVAPEAFVCTINGEPTNDFVVVNNEGVFSLQAVSALSQGEYVVTVNAEDNDDIFGTFTLTVNADPTITVNPVSAEKYVSDFSEVTLDNPLVLAEVTASDFEVAPEAFVCTINGEPTNDFVVANNEGVFSLQAVSALSQGEYVVTVNAEDNDDIFGTFTLTVNADPLDVPTWNVSELDYKFYEIVAANNDGVYSASLYGSDTPDGTQTLIETFDNVGENAQAIIIGNTLKEEGLRITTSASTNLGEIIFQGGNCSKLDRVLIDGTEAGDQYTIKTESSTINTQVFTVNPYTNLINYYKDFYGEKSPIYENIVKIFNEAYDKIRKVVVSSQADFNVIEQVDSATIKVAGAQNIAIDGDAGNDTFNIETLGTNYDFIGGEGEDQISFASDNISRAVINMDSQFAQCVVPGQIGTVRLHGDIEEVVGSQGNDSIITANNTSIVIGNGGNDAVILNGNKETVTNVTLEGRSSVVVRGDGDYTITITDGDYSVINAITAWSDSSVNLTAAGRNIAFYGGGGDDIARITGDYAYVNAGAGDDVITANGSYATILGGAGNDFIGIGPIVENEVSQGNIIYGEAGNDIIAAALTTGNNYFYAGAGNDMIIGGEGNDFIYGVSGNNVLIGNAGADRIFGGTGRDLILANTTAKIRDAENLVEMYSDLYAAWSLTDDPNLDALVELIGVESVADGEKDLLYRCAGFGNVIYSNTRTDKDFANTLTFVPYNDVLFDDFEDLI